MPEPRIFVVGGPSGCGKSTIAKEILNRHPEMTFSVSATTRQMRQGELNGRDYFFVSREDFETKIRRNELVEYENIYGEYYGTLRSEVERAFKKRMSILFDIDVNGGLAVKSIYGTQAVLIFIKPPSVEVLMNRLRLRKTETAASLEKRSERFKMELDRSKEFDHCVINDVLETAVSDVDTIITNYLKNENKQQNNK